MSTKLSPYAWICFAMCVGVMGTALASPLYPLYQAAWQLRTSTLTQLFVVYMFGVMAALLILGRATQRFGFLPVLRAGLICMTVGVLLSMLKDRATWVASIVACTAAVAAFALPLKLNILVAIAAAVAAGLTAEQLQKHASQLPAVKNEEER